MVKLGRKIGKKAKQLKAIKWYVARDFSSIQIQKKLQERKLGLRRKTLLNEIRTIKRTTTKTVLVKGKLRKVTIVKDIKVSERKRKMSIPKKYRKKPKIKVEKWIDRGLMRDKIYRTSLIVQDIPVHSRPMKRNYLGFRLQAFSLDKDYLIQQYSYLRSILIKEANEYLGFNVFENFNWNHKVLGIERCILIPVSNADRFNNIWIFRVEIEGSEIYSKDGRI